MVDSGVDPLEHDKEQAKAREVAKRAAIDRAFSTVSGNWLKAYESERRARGGRAGRLRSASTLQMAKTAMGHFQLQFAGKRVDEIDDVELSTALGKIPAAKLATRRNAFAVARIFWRWAVRQRLVDESPCDRLDAPPAPVSRSRVLSDVELGIIWRASRKMTYPFGPAFRLLILTGQRREEITAMAWGELDREARQWCIAADRTKNGLPHIVPLSAAVIAELDGLALKDEWPTKGLVFTTTGETAVSGHSGAKRQLDALADKQVEAEEADALGAWRVHDLRRTVATGLQRLGVRLEVTEAVLNHVSGSRGGIVGVYQRHNWAEEKREALGLWADAVLSLSRPKAAAGARRDAKKSSPGKAR